MKNIEDQLARADRLAAITQRIGFAIWQIQELEGVAAQYFVLIAQATKGMGTDAGNLLLVKARSKTFGATIHQMTKAGLLSEKLETRFIHLLAERNWLVHKSRSESRNAIYSDAIAEGLISRTGSMADEASELLGEIGVLAERHVRSHGVSGDQINETASRLLAEWHDTDAI